MVAKVLRKLQPVAFNVVFSSFEPIVGVMWKNGELYLSYTSVVVSEEEGREWYEVPLREISAIEVEEIGKDIKLNFRFENGTLEVKCKDRVTMLALKNFLLPLTGTSPVVA